MRKGIKNGCHTPIDLILEYLDGLVASDMTIPKYAKSQGINTQTLRQWVQRFNVTGYNKGHPNYNIDPELKEIALIRVYELHNIGQKLNYTQISKIITKEIISIAPCTVSKWLKGENCDFPWRKRLITGWKRSKQLSNYIEELKCLA